MTPIALLSSRRTIPAALLGEPGPDAGQLAAILTVATRVPDHGKLAPWRFILFEGDSREAASRALLALHRRKRPDLSETEIKEDETWFTRAPLVIALVSRAGPHVKIPQWEQELSAGAAGMNLLNAAHALGFGAQWLTGWPAYDADARALLGLREGERIAGFFHVGTPTVPPQERWRPALAELVSRWTPATIA